MPIEYALHAHLGNKCPDDQAQAPYDALCKAFTADGANARRCITVGKVHWCLHLNRTLLPASTFDDAAIDRELKKILERHGKKREQHLQSPTILPAVLSHQHAVGQCDPKRRPDGGDSDVATALKRHPGGTFSSGPRTECFLWLGYNFMEMHCIKERDADVYHCLHQRVHHLLAGTPDGEAITAEMLLKIHFMLRKQN